MMGIRGEGESEGERESEGGGKGEGGWWGLERGCG